MTSTLSGALLLDGATYEDAFAWLYQQYPDHQPLPLLSGTDYAAIADAGPILIDAPVGSSVYTAWSQGSDLGTALWLESPLRAEELLPILQRRLRIFAPDGREFWLRLGDGQALHRAWQQAAQWPTGFWHGVSGVWLQHQASVFEAWRNTEPSLDLAPEPTGIVAQITLDWPLLQALTAPTQASQEVPA